MASGGTKSAKNKSGCCGACLRWLMIVMNALMAAAAIAGFVIGLVQRDKVESMLRIICASCSGLFTAYMVFLGGLFGLSLLGCIALWTRNIWLRVVYCFFLFLLFILSLGGSITYALIATDLIPLQGFWNDAVGRADDRLCRLELDLKCSGWTSYCRTSSTRPFALLKASDLPEHCPVCGESQAKINRFKKTCETVVTSKVKSGAKYFLVVGFLVVVFSFLGMVTTCLARKRK